MIRLKSASQALSLKGQIPELAIKRMVQFQGDNRYDPSRDGYIVVIQPGDDLEAIPEAGDRGLLTYVDDDLPPFEYIFHVIEAGQRIYEAVMLLDDERTIAFIIPDEVVANDRLKRLLEAESTLALNE